MNAPTPLGSPSPGQAGASRETAAPREASPTVPRWALAAGLVAMALVAAPLAALVARADPAAVARALVSPEARTALWLSLRCAALATAAALVLGFPLALLLARSEARWTAAARAIVLLPLVLPPMVSGLALLYLLGRRGALGGALGALGIAIPFTTSAVVVAQTFVALPFLVVALEGALRAAGAGPERIAATLGASPGRVVRTITIPLLAPALTSGILLAFARALGEFGATALLAGNAAGTTRTMPLAIYTAFNGAGVSQDTAVALALLLVVAATATMVASGGWRETRGRR